MSSHDSTSFKLNNDVLASLKATGVLLLLGAVLKVLGAVQQAVLAALFGAGPELDAYFAAIAMPNLMVSFLVLGPLGLLLVPNAARSDEDDASQMSVLMPVLVANTLVVSAVFIVLGSISAPWVMVLLAPGFDTAAADLAANIFRMGTFAVGVAALNALLRGVFHGVREFSIPTGAYILSSTVGIGTVLLLSHVAGIYAAGAGIVLGALSAFVSQWMLARAKGIPLSVGAPEWSERVRKVLFPMMGVGLALASVQATGLWARIYASGLGAGAVSLLDYGLSFDKIVGGLTAMSAATAIYPSVVAGAAKAASGAAESIRYALRGVLLTSLPLTVFLVVLREPIVQLWLQRGRFAPGDAAVVEDLLLLLSPALFAWALAYPVLYSFHAISRGAWPAVLTLSGLVGGALLTYPCKEWWGLRGISVGVSLSACVTVLGLLWLLGVETPGLWRRSFLVLVAKVGLATAVGAGAAAFSVLPEQALLDLALRSSLGGGCFVALLWLSGVEEARAVVNWLAHMRPSR